MTRSLRMGCGEVLESNHMRLKPGVRVQGMQPELMLAMVVANEVYKSHNIEFVVTSVVDGRHSHTSLHYSGNALDCRTRDMSRDLAEFVTKEIKEGLGDDYDVILESNHIHIEYQPRQLC